MVSIKWNKAGDAGCDFGFYVLDGSAGSRFCDTEIMDSHRGFPRARFEAFLNEKILTCRSEDWGPTEPIQQPPILANGCGSGPAHASAFQSRQGSRVEYWTAGEGAPNDLHDDFCVLLETSSGNVLVVGIASGHPYVACNEFAFGNSDGSTEGGGFFAIDAPRLIQAMAKQAIQYLYQQQH